METTRKLHTKPCGACKRDVSWVHGNKPERCTHLDCNSILWEKPPLEVELFHLQDKFFENRDTKYIQQMYEKLDGGYIKKLVSNELKGKFHMDRDVIAEKAHDVITKFLEYYLEKENFIILHSFGGYISRQIPEVLYGDREEEDHDSLNFQLDGSNEVQDSLLNLGYNSLTEVEHDVEDIVLSQDNSVADDIFTIITGAVRRVKSSPNKNGHINAIYLLISMTHMLNCKSEPFTKKFFNFTGLQTLKYSDRLSVLVMEYLTEIQQS